MAEVANRIKILQKKDENRCSINGYGNIILYSKLLFLFTRESYFLRHIEKKSICLFIFLHKIHKKCKSIIPLINGIRNNYFYEIMYRKNIKRLPMVSKRINKSVNVTCELKLNTMLCKFDILSHISSPVFRYILDEKDGVLITSNISGENNFPLCFHDVLTEFEIRNRAELFILYFTYIGPFKINNKHFAKGEIENGVYKTYFRKNMIYSCQSDSDTDSESDGKCDNINDPSDNESHYACNSVNKSLKSANNIKCLSKKELEANNGGCDDSDFSDE